MTEFVFLAQAQTTNDLPAKLQEVLNILMMFGFLFGTVLIMGGALAIKRGDAETGKMMILGGAIIAAAPAIMNAFYQIFGHTGIGFK